MTKTMFRCVFTNVLAVVIACFLPVAAHSQTTAAQGQQQTAASPQNKMATIAPLELMENSNPVPAQPSTVTNFPEKQPDWLDPSPKKLANDTPNIKAPTSPTPPVEQNLPPGKKGKKGSN